MLVDFMSSHGWKIKSLKVPENLPSLIQTDSRRILAGQWFAPIVGEHHDGHKFIEQVCAAGAEGFLYASSHASELSPSLKDKGIEVPDTFKALQDLAQWWRAKQSQCHIVGITGSSGKTSVKELCAEMLSAISPTLKTEGSLNNELGVPLTLMKLTEKHRFGVIEMGARHKGDIAFLSHIVHQDISVLINVGSAHVGEFGGHEQLLAAKMEITTSGRSVYFRDDERIHAAMLKQSSGKLLSFGRHPEADVRVLADSCSSDGQLLLKLRIANLEHSFNFPYFHEVFALNIACAIAIGLSLHIDLEDCIVGLSRYNGIKGRFQVHRLPDLTLIDDAYNANPQSMRVGLETVRKAYPNHRKVLILGDMRELGDETESAHRELGIYCAKVIKPELLVTVGESSRWIREEAIANGLDAKRVLHYENVEAVFDDLKSFQKYGDLLYVKASNGLKLFKIIDWLLAA